MSKFGKSSVTLIVTALELDPGAATDLLELNPSKTWKKGQATILKSGKQIVNKNSGWKLFQDSSLEDSTMMEQLQAWIKILETKGAQLGRLKEMGFETQLNCFHVGETFALTIDQKLIQKLSSIGIDLEVTCLLRSS